MQARCTTVTGKPLQSLVCMHLEKYHRSPWILMGTLPHPPCTDSSTSCEDYHGQDKFATVQISYYVNELLIEKINDGSAFEALQNFHYLVCHTAYPSVALVRRIVLFILKTYDLNLLASAQCALDFLLELHPPCRYNMETFYKHFLLDSWTENGQISEGLFDFTVSQLEKELNGTGEEGVLCIYMNSEVGPKEQCFEHLSFSERLRRLFIVFKFIVDVMDYDLVVWLVKHGACPETHSMLFSEETQPLIMTATGANAYSTSVDSLSEAYERLVKLYLRALSLHHSEVSLPVFHKIFALLLETMNALERHSPNKIIFDYGANCERMVNTFLKLVVSADLHESDLIYVLQSFKPMWLPVYLGDKQTIIEIFTKINATQMTMEKYFESASVILEQECKLQSD